MIHTTLVVVDRPVQVVTGAAGKPMSSRQTGLTRFRQGGAPIRELGGGNPRVRGNDHLGHKAGLSFALETEPGVGTIADGLQKPGVPEWQRSNADGRFRGRRRERPKSCPVHAGIGVSDPDATSATSGVQRVREVVVIYSPRMVNSRIGFSTRSWRTWSADRPASSRSIGNRSITSPREVPPLDC